MGRMNISLDKEEDAKLDRLKARFNIRSKEDVIKRLIKQFPEDSKYTKDPTEDFNVDDETNMKGLI